MTSPSSDGRPTKTSRRDFIRRSSWFVAGGAVGTGLSEARAREAYGADVIRVGLVGCGRRGTSAAMQALGTPGGPVILAAIADVFGDRLQSAYRALKSRHGEHVAIPRDRQFVGVDAYSRLLETPVDLVILATPPAFRPIHFAEAVAAGKHVFMEKPVAVDSPGVRQVLKASETAERQGLAVSVGLHRHHDAAYRETIARLQSGAIGEIGLMRAYWNGPSPATTERRQGQSEFEYQIRNWQRFDWLSGRQVVEQHIHNLDVINWLKKSHPVSALARLGSATYQEPCDEIAGDRPFVEFYYPDGSKLVSQCCQVGSGWNNVSEHARGARGRADISGGKIYDAQGALAWRSQGARNGHEQQQRNLFAALRNGDLPSEGVMGAISTLTSILGRMACDAGGPVTWDDALSSNASFSAVTPDEIRSTSVGHA